MQKLVRIIVLLTFMIGGIAYASNHDSIRKGIGGKLALDKKWRPVVYLSQIPDFNERYTISNNLIIDQTQIDSNGQFFFSTEYLPEEYALYRLHISKNGYPKASLTIGGKDENFQFVIANKHSSVFLNNDSTSTLFQYAEFYKDPINQSLLKVDELSRYKDSIQLRSSTLKKELIESAIHEKMRILADTSSNLLVALYALYQSNYERNYPVNSAYYDKFTKKWEKDNSQYFRIFKSNLSVQEEYAKNYFWIVIAFGSFLLGILLAKWSFKRTAKKNPMDNLSIQEKKILKLLQEGKSNKEISEEYNIGLSTVKTHVSSILSKMNVKSRKELYEV